MKWVCLVVALAGCAKGTPRAQTACDVATKVRQGAEAAEAFICSSVSVSGENAGDAPEIWTGEE